MGVGTPRYDGLADEYASFLRDQSQFYAMSEAVLRRLLGPGSGRCLDVGCGGGRFLATLLDLGWTPVGIDESADQLRIAGEQAPGVELLQLDATALLFADQSFDAAISTSTHTDLDNFSAAMAEVLRILKRGGLFIYIGNHPCFVGATQEHRATGVPLLHSGYRRSDRWDASAAPGTTPEGWRARLGSFVHVPLAEFLNAFGGFAIAHIEEPADGSEYPKTIALQLRRP